MISPYCLIIAQTEADFAKGAAEYLMQALESIKNPLITLPTGTTPLGMYQYLTSVCANKNDLWQKIRFLALDEYVGLPPDDERLFMNWLSRVFLDPLQINNRIFFRSDRDPYAEAERVQAIVDQEGPIDIAVLGIGANGHIAFNEPGTNFNTSTHAMVLTPESITSNARYWGNEDRVPRQGITLGLGTLAQARHTILLAQGKGKAHILAQALKGAVTEQVPASYLQTIKNVTVMADHDAALYLQD